MRYVAGVAESVMGFRVSGTVDPSGRGSATTGSSPSARRQGERARDVVDDAGGNACCGELAGPVRGRACPEPRRRAARGAPRGGRPARCSSRSAGPSRAPGARARRTARRTGGRCPRRGRGRRPRRGGARTARCSGAALPMRPGVTPPAVNAVPWLTSAASREESRSTSTRCPAPVAVRWRSAARIPTEAKSPARTSTSATPTFCGSPSGAPVMLMSPPRAWMSRS